MRKLLLGLFFGLLSQAALAQTPGSLPGCQYNATPPTLSDKQTTVWQCDSSGKLITSSTANPNTVIGPGVAVTDHAIVRWDGVTGTLVEDSLGILSETGVLTGLTNATIATGTITTSQPLTLTQTWNAGGVTFTGLLTNVTSTASAAGSLLLDLQIGGVSQFSVSKAGVITTTNGTLLSAMTDTWNNAGTQFNSIKMNVTNTAAAANSAYLNLQSAGAPVYRFLATGPEYQQFNTYTSDTNFEAGGILWNSNILKIGTSKGSGGGTARDVYIVTPNSTWTFTDGSGNFGSAKGVVIQPGGTFAESGRGNIYATADGIWRMSNSADSLFATLGIAQLNINGATSSFPMLKNTGAILNVRLADDSADGDVTARTVRGGGFTVAGLPTAGVAGRVAYVTNQLGACVAAGAALTGGGVVVCPVFDNGVAWVGN